MPNLNSVSKFDRPREKISKYGAGKLSDVELLAILLRTGTKELNVLKLAQAVLKKFSDSKISDVAIADLKTIHGIGTVKACEIVACFELGKRMLSGKKSALILSPQDVWEQMADIRVSKKEHFVAFYLDTRSQEIKREIISIGTLSESLVHPREVFESAVRYNAASIIISHNHPSGDIEPSKADIQVTHKLQQAGLILDIHILDHIIVSKNSFVSMKELDLL